MKATHNNQIKKEAANAAPIIKSVMCTGVLLKIRTALIVCAFAYLPAIYSAEEDSIEERINAMEIRVLAAQGLTLDRSQLEGLCRGLEGSRWCEGYMAALLSALNIPREPSCLPITDVAPFLYGNIWELTLDWLYKQSESIEISLYDAIYTAMSEQEQCEI